MEASVGSSEIAHTSQHKLRSRNLPSAQLQALRHRIKLNRKNSVELQVLPVGKDFERKQSHAQASTSKPRPEDVFPFDMVDDEDKAIVRRKTQILMEILMAGQEIENVISKHSDDIDEQMIDLLDKRTKMASRMREGDMALGGLALVKRRLQAELENKRASPSQRLLNALLDLMQPEPGIHIEEQEEEVRRVLRYAFQPPQMAHVDIFDVAARVARGEEIEEAAPQQEGHVPQHVFVSETQQLVLQAARNLKDLERVVQRGNLGKYEAAYKHALDSRLGALQRVQAILELAKGI